MQVLIDNLDRNHFTETSYEQFIEEMDKLLTQWGLEKYRTVTIDGFNNTTKVIYMSEEAIHSLKQQQRTLNKWEDEEDEISIIQESKTPWEDEDNI